jgi:ElaB/YqjD/DUF883 family membrane-anchored ribosome-binding protein
MTQEAHAAPHNTAGNDDLHKQLATLREDIMALRTDFKGLAEIAGTQGRNRLSDARERLTESARAFQAKAKEKAQALYSAARDHTEEAAEKARAEITERPLTAVTVAFVGGAVLGGILFWRMSRRR